MLVSTMSFDNQRRTRANRRRQERPGESTLTAGIGNAAMAGSRGATGSPRPPMIAFITARLEAIAAVQQREVDLTSSRAQRDWYRAVADSQRPDATRPDPARWHPAARLYHRATEQLCRGDIAAGARLLRAAVAAEQEAFRALTSLVSTEGIDTAPANPWEERVTVSHHDPTDAPGVQALAHEILTTDDSAPEVSVKPLLPVTPGSSKHTEDDVDDPGGS